MTVAGLLATAPFAYRARRVRAMAALISGGWLAMAVGLAIGPAGLKLIERSTVQSTFPLLATGLGWIGLMVGLQLRRDVLHALPQAVKRLFAVDGVVTMVVFGGAALVLLAWWMGSTGAALVTGCLVIVAGSVGWAMETRSLRGDGGPPEERLAATVRASGSLATVLAISIFAVGVVVTLEPYQRGEQSIPAWLIAPALCAVLALFMGVAGRFMLGLAGKRPEHQLAVFLGIVAFVAGIATELDIPALFAAMLTGAVMANLKGVDLRRFERFVLAGEHALAVIFAIVAGVLIDPVIGWAGLGAAGVLVALRLSVKPALMQGTLRPERPKGDEAIKGGLPARSRLYAGSARQNPIATVILISLVLARPTEMSQELLAIVALTGLMCELLTLARRAPVGPRTAAPMSPEPDEEVAS